MTGNSLGNIVNGGIAAQADDCIYYRSSDDFIICYKSIRNFLK